MFLQFMGCPLHAEAGIIANENSASRRLRGRSPAPLWRWSAFVDLATPCSERYFSWGASLLLTDAGCSEQHK
jgi:hypothetical protein